MRSVFIALLVMAFIVRPPPPFESDWIQDRHNPVFVATQAWEQGAVYEPSVLYEDGYYKMWYSGGVADCFMGYATSSDGYRWNRHSQPVVGNGYGLWAGTACRSNVYKVAGGYQLYFTDGFTGYGDSLYTVFSSDGYSITQSPQLAIRPHGEIIGIANNTVVDVQGKRHFVYEGRTADGLWKVANENGLLPELQVSYQGMYGGVHLQPLTGSYMLYYHAAPHGGWLPTDIYGAASTDLKHWVRQAQPLVRREQSWEVDQVADPYYGKTPDRQFLFFDGCDNRQAPIVRCSIGVAWQDLTVNDGN